MAKPPTSKMPGGTRGLTKWVKTANKRSISSARWLQRQINDPYVSQAKKDGYRSRAAYKILELDEKFKLFKPGKSVLDLGAAPGGWTQVAIPRVKSTQEKPIVIAVDILEMDKIPGAIVMKLDFMDETAPDAIKAHIPEGVDVVLTDMAPNTTGHQATDHLRIMALLETVYPFACEVLKNGGAFVAKVFQGGTEGELLKQMKQDFAVVKHAKPKASRSDSAESYVVATGFKGRHKQG